MTTKETFTINCVDLRLVTICFLLTIYFSYIDNLKLPTTRNNSKKDSLHEFKDTSDNDDNDEFHPQIDSAISGDYDDNDSD